MIAIACGGVAAAADPAPVLQAVTFCDLARHPGSYAGRLIVVRASRAPSLNGT